MLMADDSYRTIKIRTFPAAGTATTHAHAESSASPVRMFLHWSASSFVVQLTQPCFSGISAQHC